MNMPTDEQVATMNAVTPTKAKKLIAAKLAELGRPAYKLTTHTTDFGGLGCGRCVFVKVHDLPSFVIGTRQQILYICETWHELTETARANGFRMED